MHWSIRWFPSLENSFEIWNSGYEAVTSMARRGEEVMNRGIIGTIIGVLVVIILVIVIMQMT